MGPGEPAAEFDFFVIVAYFSFNMMICSAILWSPNQCVNSVILFQISIPAFSVTLIKKTKTALLVPNALIIATLTDRVSTQQRKSTCFTLLWSPLP